MSNYNNVNRVLIGDGTNSGVITTLPGIQKGDLIVLNEKGVPVTTNAAAAALPKFERIVIAVGIAPGRATLSSPIQGNTASAYEGVDFRAPAEQVSFIGYNGTAGTGLTIDASTEYRLRISIQDDARTHGQRQTLMDYNYVGGATASASGAIDNIACQYAQKEYGVSYMSDKVKLERVSDGTFTAFGAGANATVTKGSDIITTAVAQAVTVGSYIRIGGTTDSVGIYKVIEQVDGSTLKIDTAYLGENEVVLVASIGIMSAQTEYGFKLTGIAQEALLSRGANEPYDQYEWILFKAFFSEADDRTIESAATYTLATNVDPGNGYWKQIAEREEDAKGYLGDTNKRMFWANRIDSVVDPSVSYDTLVVTHEESMKGDFQGNYQAPLKTEIYIPNGADQGLNSGDEFVHILNGFFGTLGFPAIVFA